MIHKFVGSVKPLMTLIKKNYVSALLATQTEASMTIELLFRSKYCG